MSALLLAATGRRRSPAKPSLPHSDALELLAQNGTSFEELVASAPLIAAEELRIRLVAQPSEAASRPVAVYGTEGQRFESSRARSKTRGKLRALLLRMSRSPWNFGGGLVE